MICMVHSLLVAIIKGEPNRIVFFGSCLLNIHVFIQDLEYICVHSSYICSYSLSKYMQQSYMMMVYLMSKCFIIVG
jgi:hypothetical protein